MSIGTRKINPQTMRIRRTTYQREAPSQARQDNWPREGSTFDPTHYVGMDKFHVDVPKPNQPFPPFSFYIYKINSPKYSTKPNTHKTRFPHSTTPHWTELPQNPLLRVSLVSLFLCVKLWRLLTQGATLLFTLILLPLYCSVCIIISIIFWFSDLGLHVCLQFVN